jgi:Ca2+-binding EF-hand superfamily protein
MNWSDFAGKLLVLPGEGTDLSDTFTGRLPFGAGSQRELKRMEFRAHHQSEIRSGGIKFFKDIYINRIVQRGFTHPSLECLFKRNDCNNDNKITLNEFIQSLNDIGIHNCANSDIKEFAIFIMNGGTHISKKDKYLNIKHDNVTNESILIPIPSLVDMVFRDPLKDHSTGAIFFSGGGSRTHERDMSVQPRGVHTAINIVRERIAAIPGMDELGGIGKFFDVLDPDGDGEIDKVELSHALKNKLKITAKDLHPKDIRGLFEHLDADGSHSIDKTEFIQVFGLPSDRKDAAELFEHRKNSTANATRKKEFVSAIEIKRQEKVKNLLLKHVRERVSLLCKRRGLKDLWITKMCQGLRKGRLNRSAFKAGLRHLGCRGFGPGDSDLLFDFCVDHATGELHEQEIGFTSFSRVFSPDTFHYKVYKKGRNNEEIEMNEEGNSEGHILPADPADLPPSKPVLNTNASPEDDVKDAYVIGLNKMERIVKEKCWSKALSNAMGASATTNPNYLKKIMKKYSANGSTLTLNEFIAGLRDINGLDIKNCMYFFFFSSFFFSSSYWGYY